MILQTINVILLYMSKASITPKIHYDPAGFASLTQTLSDAKEIDPSIKLDDVRQRMAEHTKRKKQLPGQACCVANGPHHAYQLGLMLIEHL